MEVVTFVDYQPPQRFDGLPWTQVRIEESASQDGTFTALETKALSPVDPNPAAPAYRSFTTEKGTALDYWYRVVFVDGTGDISQPTSPVQNTAGSTVTTTVYATTAELFRVLKLRVVTPEQTAAAERILTMASGEINSAIGRIDPLDPWMVQLATQVCLERGEELWAETEKPWGQLGPITDAGPVFAPRRSRALAKLAPLQQSWGVG